MGGPDKKGGVGGGPTKKQQKLISGRGGTIIWNWRVYKSNNAQSVVGHLPMEISRITKFILQKGAGVQATVTGKPYRVSPLIQGGLEVPCLVTVTVPGSIMNHLLIARYETLFGELYLEPKDEEIMGTFLSVIRENDFLGTNQCTPCEASSSTKNKKKAKIRSRDIRDMFRKKNKRCDTVITIRFWKYIRGILKVMSFLSSLPDKLSFFFRVLIFASFNCKKNFAGINFRDFNIEKNFARMAMYPRKNEPAKISTLKVSPLPTPHRVDAYIVLISNCGRFVRQ